ncbi:MAG: glycosyltransferase family 2 protein [Bacteroidales bacterium]|nr:glycosyltransferase family 2 protein [Bacteroidales bacterium]MCF8403498.1 glycosyltransferase family 2 protein [Bacteroidales bacterium]
MPKLSVVIITLNEEENIARCINSVKRVADEIIVVDSFSEDKTQKIVESLGAKFYQNKFEDYVKQHDYADKLATFDHVLSVDADECLSEDLSNSILVVKKYWKNDGYFMSRMTNYCGRWIKHSGWYPDKKLRLYDRRKGKWVGKKIHERYRLIEGSTTGHLKGDLYHYSFKSISDHVKQANKFTDLTSEVAFEAGQKSSLFKIIINPIFKFIRNYVFNFGFLDGYYGFIICQISANATFLKYVKLKQLNKNKTE